MINPSYYFNSSSSEMIDSERIFLLIKICLKLNKWLRFFKNRAIILLKIVFHSLKSGQIKMFVK